MTPSSTTSLLLAQLGDYEWQPAIEIMTVVGVADALQIRQAAGWTREVADRVLHRLTSVQVKLHPVSKKTVRIISRIEGGVHRAGSRGRPRRAYRLEEGGALLAHQIGYPKARPCQLTGKAEVNHALCILDLALAARAAGLTAAAERELPGGNVRADLLVTLPNGDRAIFEVEQDIHPETLRRAVNKARRLAAFFASPRARGFSRDVRAVYNVGERDWPAVERIWTNALATAANERDGKLPFRWMACRLADFIQQPTFATLDSFQDLFDPALVGTFGSPQDVMQLVPQEQTIETTASSPSLIPPSLRLALGRRAGSAAYDLGVMRAYAHVLDLELANYAPQPDPTFFLVMRTIYAASHDPARTALERAALPVESLVLLYKYLDRHADLRVALVHALRGVKRGYDRGVSVLCDRMTNVVWNVFLRYHGFGREGPLRVRVALPDQHRWQTDLHVEVRITDSDLVIADDGVLLPGESSQAEQALAWVLNALFRYAPELGLASNSKKKKK